MPNGHKKTPYFTSWESLMEQRYYSPHFACNLPVSLEKLSIRNTQYNKNVNKIYTIAVKWMTLHCHCIFYNELTEPLFYHNVLIYGIF